MVLVLAMARLWRCALRVSRVFIRSAGRWCAARSLFMAWSMLVAIVVWLMGAGAAPARAGPSTRLASRARDRPRMRPIRLAGVARIVMVGLPGFGCEVGVVRLPFRAT